jgi:peptidoglycan/xylan/chitin deacetylase (PgdA/CDA1 family)
MDTISLMYHAIEAPPGPGVDPHYTVGASSFVAQLQTCLENAGGVTDTLAWLAGRTGVIFTFDDGHESNYEVAFPLLAQLGATADFFVNPAQVGTPGFATWAQLREMSDGGMSIQSHGYDHAYFLTELSSERLREDLRRARVEIEQNVGRAVTLLAPPGGRCPNRLTEIAMECGYTHVLNSRPGRITSRSSRTLPRLAVTAQLDLPTLESWLRRGSALLKSQIRYTMLDVAKRALGDKRYMQMRERLLELAAS